MVGKTNVVHQDAAANAGPGNSIGSTAVKRHGRSIAVWLAVQERRKWALTYTTRAAMFMGNTLFLPARNATHERTSFH